MSCSEYLGRYKQRLTTYTDTRPHLTASHHTEIVKRQAASGNLETVVVKPTCSTTLNMTATMPNSQFYSGGGHTVQDTSLYNEYTAGQALAQAHMPANRKPAQITNLCLSSTTLPEYNDKIANDTTGTLAQIQKQKTSYGRGYATICCPTCIKVTFASGCPCSITAAMGLKSSTTRIHTIEPNVNVS